MSITNSQGGTGQRRGLSLLRRALPRGLATTPSQELIAQLADKRVEKVDDVVKEGETVRVKVLEVSRDGKIRLSMKSVDVAEA